MFFKLLQGSRLASFFMCAFSSLVVASSPPLLSIDENRLIEEVKRLTLHESPIWQAILHVKKGQPISRNYARYLSGNDFSLKEEMSLTIQMIANDPQSMCKYPARIRFLQDSLTFDQTLDMSHCTEYQEYLRKVPIANIYAVYASENVQSASSMLGHIMLRMDGVNDDGLAVKHGITFFTQLEGYNVPKILYDSLISGKKGFFQVAPYSSFMDNYLNTEQRNVWEYKLLLSYSQKQLIRDIAWELGRADLSYFFHTYNCATVTQLLIASVMPEKITDMQPWLTPLDVVRFIEANELIERTELVPSDEWELRALIDSLSKSTIKKAKYFVHTANISIDSEFSEKDQMLIMAFYKTYNKFAEENGLIEPKIFIKNNIAIRRLSASLPKFQLEVGEYKSPTDASPDGQFALGWTHQNDKNWLAIELFPVASDEGDQKKHVFGETTLTLASLGILYDPNTNNLKLDNFIIYSMQSRIPFDNTFKRYSTGFQFGLERHFDIHLNQNLSAFIEGQLGITYELTQDVGTYIETSLGFASNLGRSYLYATPQLGIYIYLIGNVKLQVQLSESYNMQKADDGLRASSLFFDWKVKNNIYASAHYSKHWNSFGSTKSYSLRVRYKF